jgi:NADH-quinone oxidoreductase subunit N
MNSTDLWAILPILVLTGWTCVLLLLDLFIPQRHKAWTAVLAALGLIAAMVATILQAGQVRIGFNNMVVADGFAIFLNLLFLGSGVIAIMLAYDYLKRLGIERGEYYTLLLFSITGMLLMAVAADLIVVFLSLELLSIPLYVLAGFAPGRLTSEESALKYFLMGAFASGFVVYGVALVFGATGSTSFSTIVQAVGTASTNPTLLVIGAAFVLVGLGFKVAAVPFHMWTPDVYQGAPSSVTAFMSIGAKAAGFAALFRVFITALPELASDLTPIMWALAAATMILGNIVAIAQTNIKRLLAYSSIAHAGYILMALVPFGDPAVARDAVASALFYLMAYALTNFTAWAVVIALEQMDEKGLELEDYAGLGKKHPWLAVAMTVAMLSFTGIPPTLGLVGKFFLFRTAIAGGFVGLALIGVITSLVSAFYYLRVVVIMYMREGDPQVSRAPWLQIAAVATALATVVLSIVASPLLNWASRALLELF